MRCGSRIAVCGLVLAAYLAMQLFVSEQQKIQELERDNQRLTQDLQRVSGELANAQHATSVALTATNSSVAVSAPPSSQERSDHAMCSIHEGSVLPLVLLVDVDAAGEEVPALVQGTRPPVQAQLDQRLLVAVIRGAGECLHGP